MLNLGGINFSLGVDTRGLNAGAQRLNQFGVQIDRISNAAVKGSDKVTRAMGAQEHAAVQALEKVKKLQENIARSNLGASLKNQLTKDASEAFDVFSRQFGRAVGPIDTTAFRRSLAGFNSDVASLGREFDAAKKRMNPPDPRGWNSFRESLNSLSHATILASGHFGGFSSRIFAFNALMTDQGLVTGLVVGSLTGLATVLGVVGTNAVKAGMQIQTTMAALEAVTGSAARSAIELQFVRDVSDKAGISFSDTARSYARFLAAGQAAGLNLDTIQKSFTQTAMAAGKLHLSVEDTQGVFRALEQILSKGTVQSEELRGQLGDRFPAAFQVAAQAVGKTTVELSNMLKKGEVVSKGFVPAFTAALAKFYNIDISKNVDTLQASLGRLQNSWTFLNLAIDRSLRISNTFKVAVDALSGGMDFLSKNMTTVMGVVGSLAGAFLGLGAVMLGGAAIQAAAAGFAMLRTVLLAAASATTILGGAQAALNAIMLANPIGAIAGMLIRLTAAVGGAVLGYKLMTEWAAKNNAALSDTSGVQQYIRMQQALKQNISATTKEMIKQQEVLLTSTLNDIKAQQAKAGRSQGAADAWTEFTGPGVMANVRPGGKIGEWLQKRADKDAQTLQDMENNRRTIQENLRQLKELMKLPEMGSGGTGVNDLIGGGKPKSSVQDDGLARIRDIIAGASEARDKLAMLYAGPKDVKLIDDLYTAKDALRELNASQLGKVDQALRAAGFASGTVEQRMAGIVSITRQANEEVQAFSRVWDHLDSDQRTLQGLKEQMDFLTTGGDPASMFVVEATRQANEELKKLGKDGLESVRQRLAEMGYYGDTAQAALAGFFAEIDRGQASVQIFSRLTEDVKQSGNQLADLQAQLGALSSGGLDAADGMDRFLKLQDKVRAYAQQFQAIGESTDFAQQKIKEYASNLLQIDQGTQALDRLRQQAERTRQAWDGMLDSTSDAVFGVLKGTQSLSDALNSLLADLAKVVWQSAITNPIKDWFQGKRDARANDAMANALGGVGTNEVSKLGEAASMASTALRGNFAGALLQGVLAIGTKNAAELSSAGSASALAGAAIAASSAMYSLTAATYAAAAAQSAKAGSSFIKGVTSLAKVTFAAQGGYITGPGTGTSDSISAMLSNGEFVMNAAATRKHRYLLEALNMGQPMKFAEGGYVGNKYTPQITQWTAPNSSLTTSQQPIIIDASVKNIDARGATPDAVNALREEMAMRDRRLRTELPSLIDARVINSSGRGRY